MLSVSPSVPRLPVLFSVNSASSSCDASSGRVRPQTSIPSGDQYGLALVGMMEDETVTPVVNDVVKPSLESVGRARRHDRAVKIEQGRRYGGWEGVGQVAFVVRRLVEQRDVILSAPAGAPCVVDRPEINMPLLGRQISCTLRLTETPGTVCSASATSFINGDISA